MKKEITHINGHQIGKLFSLITFLFSLIVFVPVALVQMFHFQDSFGALTYLAIPFVYLVLIYIFWVIWSFVYNFMAKHVGGIEIELKDIE